MRMNWILNLGTASLNMYTIELRGEGIFDMPPLLALTPASRSVFHVTSDKPAKQRLTWSKLAIMPTQSEKIRKTGHTGHISRNWYHSHGQLASFQRGSPVHPFPHNSSSSWKVCPLLHLHLVVKHQHRRVLQVVRGLRPGHGLSRRACVQIVRRHSLRRMPIPLRASWNYHLSAVMNWGMFWWSPGKIAFRNGVWR